MASEHEYNKMLRGMILMLGMKIKYALNLGLKYWLLLSLRRKL